MKTLNTLLISIVLCLLPLAGCSNLQVKSTMGEEVRALTEPTPGPTKKINQLWTEEDLEEFAIEADGAWKMGNADKARLRELLMGSSDPLWKRLRDAIKGTSK